jgi:hypothetical protein
MLAEVADPNYFADEGYPSREGSEIRPGQDEVLGTTPTLNMEDAVASKAGRPMRRGDR